MENLNAADEASHLHSVPGIEAVADSTRVTSLSSSDAAIHLVEDEETDTPGEVARRFKVSTDTVAKWDRAGLLKAERTAGGHRRFAKSEVRKFHAAMLARQMRGEPGLPTVEDVAAIADAEGEANQDDAQSGAL